MANNVVHLHTILFDRSEPVTVQWLASKTGVATSQARETLHAFAEEHQGAVTRTYAVSGDMIHTPTKAVLLVTEDQLPAVEQRFVNPVVQLHSVAPAKELHKVRSKDLYMLTTNM